MVGREGFEPPYREAGQIYSLLPLTTRPPARAQKETNHLRRSPRESARLPFDPSIPHFLEPAKGFEPATFRLQIGCSTVELRRRCDRGGCRPIAVHDLAVFSPPSSRPAFKERTNPDRREPRSVAAQVPSIKGFRKKNLVAVQPPRPPRRRRSRRSGRPWIPSWGALPEDHSPP